MRLVSRSTTEEDQKRYGLPIGTASFGKGIECAGCASAFEVRPEAWLVMDQWQPRT